MERSGEVGTGRKTCCVTSDFVRYDPVVNQYDGVVSSHVLFSLNNGLSNQESLIHYSYSMAPLLDLGCHSQGSQLIRTHWQ